MIRYAIINQNNEDGEFEFLSFNQQYWSHNLKKVQKELKELTKDLDAENYEDPNYSIIKLTIQELG